MLVDVQEIGNTVLPISTLADLLAELPRADQKRFRRTWRFVRQTMDELIKNGIIRRGTIYGITLQAMNADIAQQLGAPDAKGVLVTRVDPRSRAAESGLRPGDVIVTFNSRTIEGASHFLRLLGGAEIGSTAALTIIRDGRRATVQVPIEEEQPTRGRRR